MTPAAGALLAWLNGKRPDLSESEWDRVIEFADRTQCTLFLHSPIPDRLAESLDRRRAANRIRRARLMQDYQAIADVLFRAGLEHVLLKSFTHETGFGFCGEDRVQYDLDLLLEPAQVPNAQRVICERGYVPVGKRDLSQVHQRPLARPSDWKWRGDYYDPDMPIAVELHHCLWSGPADRLPLPEFETCWQRRTTLHTHGITMPALCESDRVAFAALHVLRHALHNNIRISHVFELARMLESREGDPELWKRWRTDHGSRSRRLQSVAMRLASAWFPASAPPAVAEEWRQFPGPVKHWFEHYAYSPLENLLAPNKNVLWLHRELVEGSWDRFALVCQRLVPLKLPEPGRARERIAYHARAFLPALLRRTPSSAPHTSD